MSAGGTDRVVFMAGCDGPLAHALVSALAAPGLRFALHAEYRNGIDGLIELARGRGAAAISVSDAVPNADQSLLRPAAERCIRELGRIDLAVQADVPDASVFPRSIGNPESPAWWTQVFEELRTSAELIAGVAPLVARGGKVVALAPSGSAQAGPLFAAAAAAFASLVPSAKAELEPAGVALVAVPVEPVHLGGWQCFDETPSDLLALAGQIVAAVTA